MTKMALETPTGARNSLEGGLENLKLFRTENVGHFLNVIVGADLEGKYIEEEGAVNRYAQWFLV